MAPRTTNPKTLRTDLVKALKVELFNQGVTLTPELEARIAAKALAKHPRTVSEAPDGFWNHSNSTVLRCLAGLFVEGVELEGSQADTFDRARTSGVISVVEETDEAEGYREGDVVINGTYIVRRSADASGHHVFRKGGERSGSSVADMASDLTDEG